MNAAGDWGSRGKGRVKRGRERRRREEREEKERWREVEISGTQVVVHVAQYNTANEGAYERKYDKKMEKEKWNLASFPDLPTIQFLITCIMKQHAIKNCNSGKAWERG